MLILHVGSNQFGKENSIKRFINNFNKLPDYLKECIVIENDDKVFNVDDCIKISNELNIRIVLDYHHYLCNKSNNLYLDKIFEKWRRPKIHFSSPKSNKEKRSHSTYINLKDFLKFLNLIKQFNQDVDIMLECKGKDEALFRLSRQLREIPYIKYIDNGTFEIK